jgi:hypothetical protein
MAKMLEDAFRALGILAEDTPEYVARTILESVSVSKPKAKARAVASSNEADAPHEDTVEITINSL